MFILRMSQVLPHCNIPRDLTRKNSRIKVLGSDMHLGTCDKRAANERIHLDAEMLTVISAV